MYIIVRDLNDPSNFRVWIVSGHVPHNFVCFAPAGEAERAALIAEQEQGGQALIAAHVASQTEGQ